MSPIRANITRRLSSEEFDLIVVGGGITGACLAYDAARRGLSTALLESSDFGGATSAASTKLLHGGIRYLQQAKLAKVRESAFERVYFQNLAGHLCRYVPFVIPTFPGLMKGKALLSVASAAYSALTAGQNRVANHATAQVPPVRMIQRQELYGLAPWFDASWPATGAILLPECHMHSSERMTLGFIEGAHAAGAAVCNYANVESVRLDGKHVTGVAVRLQGGEEFEVRGKVVANCAGPWINSLDRVVSGQQAGPVNELFRGSHIVTRDLGINCALGLPTQQQIQGLTNRGGRHVFMLPWRGHTLIGTSYANHPGNLDAGIHPTESDVQQLTDSINGALGVPIIDPDNIVHAYSGIYPITSAQINANKYQGESDYQIVDFGPRFQISGYFSVFGAKFTTARALAEKACDQIVKCLGKPVASCTTRMEPLPCASYSSSAALQADCRANHPSLSKDAIEHLVTNYGSNVHGVLRLTEEDPSLAQAIGTTRSNIAAEAVYCARHEMVEHLADFIFRRTGIGTIGNPGASTIERCCRLLASELGWSAARAETELAATRDQFPKLGFNGTGP